MEVLWVLEVNPNRETSGGEAQATGGAELHLDSGYERHDAHRLYLNRGPKPVYHHFTLALRGGVEAEDRGFGPQRPTFLVVLLDGSIPVLRGTALPNRAHCSLAERMSSAASGIRFTLTRHGLRPARRGCWQRCSNAGGAPCRSEAMSR
jgi:hypothetical protein